MMSDMVPLVVTLGSINLDITAFSEHLPRPSQTVKGSRYSMELGGKGANQAAAIARLGGRSTFIGRVGRDKFGATARDQLSEIGVDTSYLASEPNASTGVAVIMVDEQGENSIVVVGGANSLLDHTDVERAETILRAAQVLQLQLETPLSASMTAAAIVRAIGGIVILDPAPVPDEGLPREALRSVDFVTPNETEAEALVGIRPTNAAEAAEAAARLLSAGAPAAIIKMGWRGAYYRDEQSDGLVPASRVDSINSVGAGDSFNGGLAMALARGNALADAVRFAAACGALATVGPGAATSAPTIAAVRELMDSGGR